ncbi:MAG: hypothetical protein QXU95_03435 [Candidatus Bathyarchaeia archaeon]
MVKALPVILLFVLNFLVILLGAPLVYTLNTVLYRWSEPILGRFLTTLVQAILSAALVFLWLYAWRLVYHLMFKRGLGKVSREEISQ